MIEDMTTLTDDEFISLISGEPHSDEGLLERPEYIAEIKRRLAPRPVADLGALNYTCPKCGGLITIPIWRPPQSTGGDVGALLDKLQEVLLRLTNRVAIEDSIEVMARLRAAVAALERDLGDVDYARLMALGDIVEAKNEGEMWRRLVGELVEASSTIALVQDHASDGVRVYQCLACKEIYHRKRMEPRIICTNPGCAALRARAALGVSDGPV